MNWQTLVRALDSILVLPQVDRVLYNRAHSVSCLIVVVERDIQHFLEQSQVRPPKPFDIASIHVPSTALTERTVSYANEMLHPAIFNHSNRVYYLGAAMVQDYLPQWKFKWEDYFLTSILHDIGLAPSLQLNSPLSFEYLGGIHAREKLVEFGAPQFQADEVAEAIIRHTDDKEGYIRQSGYMIQMSTTIDVTGRNPQWYHPHTIDQTVQKFPRLGFNNVFADAMVAEYEQKPGSNLCKRDIKVYEQRVRNNPVMEQYDRQ